MDHSTYFWLYPPPPKKKDSEYLLLTLPTQFINFLVILVEKVSTWVSTINPTALSIIELSSSLIDARC